MTAQKKTETSAVASMPPEIESKTRPPVKHDARGPLLEKQQAAGEAHRANKAGEPPVVAEPVKPKKRKTVSVQAAVRNYEDVKLWFVRATLHRERNESVYELSRYFGTVAALPGIIDRHVERRINLARDGQRLKEILLPHKQSPIPAPSEVTQQRSKSGRVTIAPRMKRPIGPSDLQSVVATSILLRSLAAVTSKDALLAVKAEVIRREITLQETLKNWNPEKRLERPGATVGDNPSSVVVTDTEGQQIFAKRMELAKAIEVVRQREVLAGYYRTLKKDNRWLYDLLHAVDEAREAEMVAQLKRDGIAEQAHAKGMIRAGYETDFYGTPYSELTGDKT